MKSGIAAFIQAVHDMADNFSGRISILLTFNEESEEKHGTQTVLKHRLQKGTAARLLYYS